MIMSNDGIYIQISSEFSRVYSLSARLEVLVSSSSLIVNGGVKCLFHDHSRQAFCLFVRYILASDLPPSHLYASSVYLFVHFFI